MSELEPELRSQLEPDADTIGAETSPVSTNVRTARLTQPFGAFRHRNFRLFFSGQIISLSGTWLQNVAHGWLVYQITNSEFLLGLVSFFSALPMLLFSLPAGVVADRFRKRNLLLATQSCAMVLAFILAALVHWDMVTIYHLIAVGVLFGTVHSFDAPIRHSFIYEMVGKTDLMNAIALNSASFNSARIIGPAVAGIVIAYIGIDGAFFLNGVSFIAVLISLSLMRISTPVNNNHQPPMEGLREGLSFIRSDRVIMGLLMLTAILSIFATSYMVLMPVFAKNILKVGAGGLGYLMAAAGLGAVIGALTLSSLGDFQAKGRLLLAGNLTFCTMLMLFSFSDSMALSMALLVVAGWGVMLNMALTNTMIQTLAPDHLRGRVVSAYTWMFLGMAPIGSFQAGMMAEWLGAPMAVRIGAIICAAAALILSPRFIRATPDRPSA